MTTKTYNNTKTHPVLIQIDVCKNNSLAEDLEKFITTMEVTSPKTGRVLRDCRLSYLNSEDIYQFWVKGAVNGVPTFEKILKAFENATRITGVTYFDTLSATVDLTAHDLHCIQLAWDGWQNRQQDYAD